MGKKKSSRATLTTETSKVSTPRSFSGVIRGKAKSVQRIAQAVRELIHEELADAEESYYGGQRPMAMYRTTAEVCWLQPLKSACNVYFLRGPDLDDPRGLLEGSSNRQRFVKIKSLDEVDEFPLRQWIQQSVALNEAAVGGGLTFNDVHTRLQAICGKLPEAVETITWGKPHFRVNKKIFCGCGEDQGGPRLGLKMEPYESEIMMKLPGIVKAPYSRKGDGWVQVDPNEFDDWEEIERFVVGSYRLIAPKHLLKS